MYCIDCGGANPSHAKFCRVCGLSFTVHIPALSASSQLSPAPVATNNGSLPPATPVDTGAQPAVLPALSRMIKQRYRIVSRLGSGGYGQVYEAVDMEFMKRRVAVKEIIQHGLSQKELAEATEGFKREATLLASLTHPNLPSIYDYFIENGNWYLVMSFIEGTSLDMYQVQKGGRLPVEKVLQISIQLAAVLSYLHTRKPPIIFRDLKPSNVMRTPEGQIYLIDFGIARHFKQGQPKDTMILGSPGYAAPEQYGRRQTTPQADIYSLGAVLHELISGQNPAQTPFSHAPLDLPTYPHLRVLIQCMLELDVKKRPVSMLNIQHELQRIATGRVRRFYKGVSEDVVTQTPPLALPAASAAPPPHAPAQFSPVSAPIPVPASPPAPTAQWSVSGSDTSFRQQAIGRKVLNGLGVLAESSLDSLRVMGTFLSTQAVRGQGALAARRQGNAPGLESGSFLAWSPDSQFLAIVKAGNEVLIFDTGTWQLLCSYTGQAKSQITALAWSADSTRVTSAALDGSVHLWDATNGRSLSVLGPGDTSVRPPVLALAWSLDGNSIAMGDVNGTISLCIASNLSLIKLLPSLRWPICALAWSPDGNCLAIGGADGSAVCVDVLSASSLFILVGHQSRISSLGWSPDGLTLASASWDHTVRLWNADDGGAIFTYGAHTRRVTALAWSPTGEYIASASIDQTVRIWRAPYGSDVLTYTQHRSGIPGLSWSGDDRLASVDTSNIVRIWSQQGTTLHQLYIG